eukprot:TRINITY_DN309_c0_g2_i2.p1 TRINITY_DN309_c0_g2~~TRINITY_DN309_c0_g2_i2.p1  ORF type:complete len:134 (-),score=23.96 TRINITY_DN309_c0_g2_i2:61-462(-)
MASESNAESSATPVSSPEAKEFYGGCHCKAVRFVVQIDNFNADDCNCSICTMKGIEHCVVPPEKFRLLQGEDMLTTYTFHTGVAQHKFCKNCGIQSFYQPRSHPGWFDVNIRCLDGDARSLFRVTPYEGKSWQ